MDWKDPRLTELILQYTLITAAVIAIVAGYMTSSLKMMFLVYGGCVFVILLIIVPDWPYFCRHPREWMTPKRADERDSSMNNVINSNNNIIIDNDKRD